MVTPMPKTPRQRDEEAIGWVIRLRDGAPEDWQAFTLWLEADPAHLQAYEAAAVADAEADGLSPRVSAAAAPVAAWQPGREREQQGHGRRTILGWSVAACLALAGAWNARGGSSGYSVETRPGERRTVALADGTRIELNGGSKLILDEERPRFASLARGEALFRVAHDPARPFEVEAAGALLRDMGTVFNVVGDGAELEVAVAEGAVLFNPAGEAANLRPGMVLRRPASGPVRIFRTDTASIGAWQEGRLVYSGTPVSEIAADLSRNLGVKVTVPGAAAARRFSGIIVLDGGPDVVLGRSAALLGLQVARTGSSYTLTTGTGAAR
jgi:transmembrane sensor